MDSPFTSIPQGRMSRQYAALATSSDASRAKQARSRTKVGPLHVRHARQAPTAALQEQQHANSVPWALTNIQVQVVNARPVTMSTLQHGVLQQWGHRSVFAKMVSTGRADMALATQNLAMLVQQGCGVTREMKLPLAPLDST